MAQKRYYKDLRTLAKRANQRMIELEKRGLKTGAYTRVQGRLELMGVKKKKATGRRFSETGKATYNEYQVMKKFLNKFLSAQTSTVTGTNKFYDDVWEGAKRNLDIEAYGITRNEYMEIWENLPSKKKDRLYGSGTIIKMVSAAIRKDDEKPKDENKMTVAEIVKAIQTSQNVKDAYKKIGISHVDMRKLKGLGKIQ